MFFEPTQSTTTPIKAFRGSFLDFIEDPFYVSTAASVRYIADGMLVLEKGKVKELGNYENLKNNVSSTKICR